MICYGSMGGSGAADLCLRNDDKEDKDEDDNVLFLRSRRLIYTRRIGSLLLVVTNVVVAKSPTQ